jgi:hypothetical protein
MHDTTPNPAIDKARARLSGLLHPSRTHAELLPDDPVLPPADVGAEDAAGYRVEEPPMRVTVYFSSSWDAANDLAFALESRFSDDPSLFVTTGTNGVMTFYGETRLDGPHGDAAQYALNDILSAFSGDE